MALNRLEQTKLQILARKDLPKIQTGASLMDLISWIYCLNDIHIDDQNSCVITFDYFMIGMQLIGKTPKHLMLPKQEWIFVQPKVGQKGALWDLLKDAQIFGLGLQQNTEEHPKTHYVIFIKYGQIYLPLHSWEYEFSLEYWNSFFNKKRELNFYNKKSCSKEWLEKENGQIKFINGYEAIYKISAWMDPLNYICEFRSHLKFPQKLKTGQFFDLEVWTFEIITEYFYFK